MIEVVTSKEFNEFKKGVEKRLDASEKKLEELIKDVEERHESSKADLEKAVKALNTRIDDVEESSKSFVVRLKEAMTPRPAEPHEKLKSQT